ncbi:MAG: hypothetical protein J0L66_00470 [Cytophagales bacterium]|nr:hypothetical protein [Cytophagales bacterium]
MELALYHGQDLVYGATVSLLVVRMILNFIIYVKIDSVVTQSNPTIWQTMTSHSYNEKEDLANTRPSFDVDKGKGSLGNTEIFHIALTFWWPLELWDTKFVKRLKRIANILNLVFLLLLVVTVVLFLHMQEVNVRYHNIKRDWTKTLG